MLFNTNYRRALLLYSRKLYWNAHAITSVSVVCMVAVVVGLQHNFTIFFCLLLLVEVALAYKNNFPLFRQGYDLVVGAGGTSYLDTSGAPQLLLAETVNSFFIIQVRKLELVMVHNVLECWE